MSKPKPAAKKKKPAKKTTEKPAAKAQNSGIHPVSKHFLFLDNPNIRTLISFIVVGIAVALLVADFAVHRHDETRIGGINGFYAIYGFIGFVLIVLAGWPLRALLGRGEDYYGEPDDDA